MGASGHARGGKQQDTAARPACMQAYTEQPAGCGIVCASQRLEKSFLMLGKALHGFCIHKQSRAGTARAVRVLGRD